MNSRQMYAQAAARQASYNKVTVAPGRYYMGASSSPDFCIVTSVNEQFVMLTTYPHRQPRRMERSIFRSLALTGLGNKAQQLRYYNASAIGWYGEADASATQEIAYCENLLAGGMPEAADHTMYQPVTVIVAVGDVTGDPWSKWEQTYPNTVSYAQNDMTLLGVSTDRAEALQMQTNPPAGFTVLRIEENE